MLALSLRISWALGFPLSTPSCTCSHPALCWTRYSLSTFCDECSPKVRSFEVSLQPPKPVEGRAGHFHTNDINLSALTATISPEFDDGRLLKNGRSAPWRPGTSHS